MSTTSLRISLGMSLMAMACEAEAPLMLDRTPAATTPAATTPAASTPAATESDGASDAPLPTDEPGAQATEPPEEAAVPTSTGTLAPSSQTTIEERELVPAPASLASSDWIPFLCDDCIEGDPRALRAVRCDGSEEIIFDLPFEGAVITGATFGRTTVVVTVEVERGWDTYLRDPEATWTRFEFRDGPTGPFQMGSPHVAAHFSPIGSTLAPDVIVFNRSGLGANAPSVHADIVSYLNVGDGTWYDYLGTSTLLPEDTDVVFGVIPGPAVVDYFHSPSGGIPEESLSVDDLTMFSFGTIALDPPRHLAGLRDRTVAALIDDAVIIVDADSDARRTLDWPDPIQGIYAPDEGGLAFASGNELYCEPRPGEIVRLTDTAEAERLLLR